ncbi:SRPBCC domain-containing protein [Ekhidna sp.]|uniref:SRPBCC family protein n=1 Tax=Ekhidna sp. TaxID=2608089 RepID=UPI00329A527A
MTVNNNPKTITIKRTLDAPIEVVWEAWTQAEHIVNWWGPQGIETEIVEHNFNVGGRWKYIMAMPGGKDFIAEGEYLEIVAPNKLITSANFLPMTEGVIMEVHLKRLDDKTDFTFNVIHKTEEYKLQQEKMGVYNGWGSAFDRLAEFLSRKIIELSQQQTKSKNHENNDL